MKKWIILTMVLVGMLAFTVQPALAQDEAAPAPEAPAVD